ncbi:MAG: hypothetical protein ACE5SW_12450 [Nitrososphaeraceae archaeon]
MVEKSKKYNGKEKENLIQNSNDNTEIDEISDDDICSQIDDMPNKLKRKSLNHEYDLYKVYD